MNGFLPTCFVMPSRAIFSIGVVDLRVLQTLLGHADISTDTDLHSIVMEERLRQTVFDFHPLSEGSARDMDAQTIRVDFSLYEARLAFVTISDWVAAPFRTCTVRYYLIWR